MKKFLFGLFFGGDDVIATVFQMLNTRLEALKHRRLRVEAEAEVKKHLGNEATAVAEFVALRKAVANKLLEVEV